MSGCTQKHKFLLATYEIILRKVVNAEAVMVQKNNKNSDNEFFI